MLVPTDTSGLIRGRLTVEDTDGGVVTEDFELNVTARRFSLTWVEETVTVSWDGYLDQGDRWEENHIPGEGVRVMAYEALLDWIRTCWCQQTTSRWCLRSPPTATPTRRRPRRGTSPEHAGIGGNQR